jgi:putative DNA primase/helicase
VDNAIEQFRTAIYNAGLTPPEVIKADGKLHRFASNGKRHDDAGWYVYYNDGIPAGAFGDWRSGTSERWRADIGCRPSHEETAHHARLESRRSEREADDAQRKAEARDKAVAIWQSSMPARGTLVEIYLKSRGICLPPPDVLRFHSGLKHPSGRTWPAMVALVTNGKDGSPLAIHRTFLSLDGCSKAPVEPQKMMLGPCRGGAVRLAAPGDLLMIGEGIETCLAAMQGSGHPAWAALSTSGLRALDLPDDVRDVIVLADGDDPGEAAARDCALRWKRERRRVRIARPPTGMDFNDLLRNMMPTDEAGR